MSWLRLMITHLWRLCSPHAATDAVEIFSSSSATLAWVPFVVRCQANTSQTLLSNRGTNKSKLCILHFFHQLSALNRLQICRRQRCYQDHVILDDQDKTCKEWSWMALIPRAGLEANISGRRLCLYEVLMSGAPNTAPRHTTAGRTGDRCGRESSSPVPRFRVLPSGILFETEMFIIAFWRIQKWWA